MDTRTTTTDCQDYGQSDDEDCTGTVTATGNRTGGEAECDTCDYAYSTH